jgi:hypothetical protein
MHLCGGRDEDGTADRMATWSVFFTQKNALFRIFPVLKEGQEVPLDSFGRIQHVQTGRWLGDADETRVYARRQYEAIRKKVRLGLHAPHRPPAISRTTALFVHASPLRACVCAFGAAVCVCTQLFSLSVCAREAQYTEESMESLTWDDAELYTLNAVSEVRYDDVFALLPVTESVLRDFYFCMGLIPPVATFVRRTADADLKAQARDMNARDSMVCHSNKTQ